MPLTDRLAPGHPHEARLQHCETVHLARESGARICQNLAVSLDTGVVDDVLFQRFCQRLGELLPDPPRACDEQSVLAAIDNPEAFCCRGPAVERVSGDHLSRLFDVNAFFYARHGRRPNDSEYADEVEAWRMRETSGRAVARHTLRMRGRRPFFWVTASDAIRPFAFEADRARDAVGLSHLRRARYLLEARVRRDQVERLNRPTGLDALDSPTFNVAVGAGGWGVTDDLAGPRPTLGVSEAVTPAVELECDVIPWGELQRSPARI